MALAILALAKADESPAYGYAPAYNTPVNYQFNWEVKDDYAGLNYGQDEARAGQATNGQYSVLLPDGRTQTVTYAVQDGYSGYSADVKYSGEAHYEHESYKPEPYKPAPYKPEPYKPVTYKPVTYKPVTYKPVTYKPVTYKPATYKPEPYKPEPKPEPYKPEPIKPVTYKPVTYKPEPYNPVTYKPEPYKPVTYKPVTYKPEPVYTPKLEPKVKEFAPLFRTHVKNVRRGKV